MQGVRPADEDRLPWLEPYRDTKAPARPVPRRGRRRPLAYVAGIGLLLTVGAGGYWLGQRDDLSAPPPPSTIVALPAPKPEPAPVAAPVPIPAPVKVAEAPPLVAAPEVAPASRPVVKKAAPKKTKKAAVRTRPQARKIRTAGIENARLNAVRAAQERRSPTASAPRPVSRSWPKMPSPGPAGQVIQLGAFTSVARAGNAYRSRAARYPLLARMPRVIVPVVTKPDSRVLYVLRLGTTSRQQSKTVCRNLRRSGDHCLVIG